MKILVQLICMIKNKEKLKENIILTYYRKEKKKLANIPKIFVTSIKLKGVKMENTYITEEKLIKIYNFLNGIGHLKVLDVNEARRLANEIENYVHNS